MAIFKAEIMIAALLTKDENAYVGAGLVPAQEGNHKGCPYEEWLFSG
jgi:hypothetical protein